MSEYTMMPLAENVEEMFIGPFGSSLKNDCFVDEESGFCMVYEQKHAIQKTMDVETRFVDEKKYNELKRFNVRGGDIIVSCRGTIGETFVVPEDAPLGIMHPSIMKIRLKDGVYDKFYFNLLLQKRLKGHEAEANGSGIKMAISAKALGAELFPVPTMKEQTQITDVISKVQSIIDDRKMELQKLDELIKARFVEMFGTVQNNHYSYRVSTLEAIAEEFFAGGDKPKDCSDSQDSSHPFPVYANGYEVEGLQGYSEKCRVSKQAITVSARGTIGYCFIRKANFAPVVRLITIVPNSEVSVEYLKYAVDTMQIKSSGTNQAQLTVPDFKKEQIIVPPMNKQAAFSTFVQQVDKSKVVVQKALDEAQTLFDSLMQKYFGIADHEGV